MLVYKPEYYDRFRCAAGACPDSCCKEWEVQVDEEAAERYRALPGPQGDRLRQVLKTQDGETVMTIENGRCPMWNEDGLCCIQLALGEGALCKVCREFPRLTHDYGDFIELGLELSCPEAAKYILSASPAPLKAETRPGEGEADYDGEAMSILKATRAQILHILSDETRPVPEVLTLALLYGYQAQGELDSGERAPFDAEAALEEAAALAKPGDAQALLDFFLSLELLTPEWEAMLHDPTPSPWGKRHLAFARYLVERYWLQAVSDYDLYGRVKFIITACLLIKHLGGELSRTAQLFSKEIENDADNVDAILDAAYSHDALRDDRLLGLLRQ